MDLVIAARLVEELTRPGAEERYPVLLRALLETDSLNHPLVCECVDCSCPPPRYARPWGGSS